MISRREQALSYAVLLAFAVFALWPLLSTTLVAFNPPGATVHGLAIPTQPSLDSFIAAWTDPDAGIGRSLRNSFILAVTVVSASVFLSILTGFAFGTMRFRGSRLLYGLFLVGLVVPYESTIIPLYYEFRALRLIDTYWAMILPDIGGSLAFGTFWMASFFRGFPRSCSTRPALTAQRVADAWRVIVPTAGAATFALATILFIWTWNNLLLAIVMIPNAELQMAPAALNYFVGRQFGLNYQVTSAAAILVALPVLVVYYVLQRRYGTDVLSGSLKG